MKKRYFLWIGLIFVSIFLVLCSDDETKSLDEKACEELNSSCDAITAATKNITADSIVVGKNYQVTCSEFVSDAGDSQGFGGYLAFHCHETSEYYLYLDQDQPFSFLYPNPDYDPTVEGSEHNITVESEKNDTVNDCSTADARYKVHFGKDTTYYIQFYNYAGEIEETKILLYK